MSTRAKHGATTPIPVQLSAPEFHECILPHLSRPKRGPQCTLGYHGVFTLILWVRYTGRPWKCLPVPKDTHGNPAIHDTTVYKVFAKWVDEGSLWQAFMASVAHLAAEKHLDLSVLHGDGTTTVAKNGGMALATRATSTRKERRSSPYPTPMAMGWLPFPWPQSMRRTWSCCRKGCKP
jgi:hypothetical protein